MGSLIEPCVSNLYYRLFEEHQDLLALFTKFHQLKTRDEQASSAELAEHATNVMNTLDESIRTMDNMDEFLLYLHQIGQSHCKIPGFQKEYFRVSKKIRSSVATWLEMKCLRAPKFNFQNGCSSLSPRG